MTIPAAGMARMSTQQAPARGQTGARPLGRARKRLEVLPESSGTVSRFGGLPELLLELLELLLGVFAARSSLLRELFRLGLLHFVQLLQLFLTRWQIQSP